MTDAHWSVEKTDDTLYADRRNFYKVEKWRRGWLQEPLLTINRHRLGVETHTP
jgi:hypothetical protein